jgi:prevent-host-death family protein
MCSMQRHATNLKGSIAELKIAAAAAELGIPVLRPMTEHGRYDLAFELGGEILRVQCKWASRHDDVVIVRLSSYRISTRGRIRTVYSSDEIDAVAAYCGELDRVYLVPADLIDGLSMLHLRLSPPRNGQRAALHWAADYELGAVAQGKSVRLAAERTWVRIPPAPSGGPCVVGAHEFRNRFGWYLERAAAGEEIRVTRRGRPHVRLLAETPQLRGVPTAELPQA